MLLIAPFEELLFLPGAKARRQDAVRTPGEPKHGHVRPLVGKQARGLLQFHVLKSVAWIFVLLIAKIFKQRLHL